MTKSVLIVGAGLGLSSSLAKCCADRGMKVALAARNLDKLEAIARNRCRVVSVQCQFC